MFHMETIKNTELLVFHDDKIQETVNHRHISPFFRHIRVAHRGCQEETTEFITNLRAKGWGIYDAQQEARHHGAIAME